MICSYISYILCKFASFLKHFSANIVTFTVCLVVGSNINEEVTIYGLCTLPLLPKQWCFEEAPIGASTAYRQSYMNPAGNWYVFV